MVEDRSDSDVNRLLADHGGESDGPCDDVIPEWLRTHRRNYPGNNDLLNAPAEHADSDTVRYNRMMKAMRRAGFEVSHDTVPQNAKQILLMRPPERGDFNALKVWFYGETVEARCWNAAQFQPFAAGYGFPLAVTREGKLYNPSLHTALDADTLYAVEIGYHLLGPYGLGDMTIAELLDWLEICPRWDFLAIYTWRREGFTPSEAKKWSIAAPLPVEANFARGWKQAGRSTRDMNRWVKAYDVFRDYKIAKDWVEADDDPWMAGAWARRGISRELSISMRARDLTAPQGLVLAELDDDDPIGLLEKLTIDECVELYKCGYGQIATARLIGWMGRAKSLSRDEIVEWALTAPPSMCGHRHRAAWLKAGLSVADIPEWRKQLGYQFSLKNVLHSIASGS